MKVKVLFLLLFTWCSIHAQDQKQKQVIEDSKQAKSTFLSKDKDMGKFFSKSYGYVIFPNIGKGGIGVGGATGNGTVYEKGKIVGMAKMTQVSIGLQLGGQSYSEVVFFETVKEMKRFKENNIEFSAQVSAVAAASGASANAKYVEGVLVFTVQKGGLMYEASVGGQKFKYTPLK
jgi:lipid-binding SYLF domain-containing protein